MASVLEDAERACVGEQYHSRIGDRRSTGGGRRVAIAASCFDLF